MRLGLAFVAGSAFAAAVLTTVGVVIAYCEHVVRFELGHTAR